MSFPSRAEVRQVDGLFRGAGGGRIHRRSWIPPGPSIGTILVVHGAFEHGGRYDELARRLAGQGWLVGALDLPGHGLSSGQRGMIERLDQALADIANALELSCAEADRNGSGRPAVLLGHSLGGMLSLEFALRAQEWLDGLILLAPAVTDEAANFLVRKLAGVLSKVAPRLPAARLPASGMTADRIAVEHYKRDPLINQGRLPIRTAYEALVRIETLHDRVGEITLPVLLLSGEEDGFTPPASGRALLSRMGSRDASHQVYDGLKHQLNQESPAARERVFRDIEDWLAARFPHGVARSQGGSGARPSVTPLPSTNPFTQA